MTRGEKIRKEARAQQAFQKHIVLLRIDMSQRAVARRHLDCRVELLEQLVEQTGGSQLTDIYRTQLATLKRQVVLRGMAEDRTAVAVGR